MAGGWGFLIFIGIAGFIVLFALGSGNSRDQKDVTKSSSGNATPSDDLQLLKAQILNDLEEGHLNMAVTLEGAEILTEPDETPIWGFSEVKHEWSKASTRTRYVGGSHGVSVRLMKGLSYRGGSFSGTPVKTEHVSHEEEHGILVVASRNVYFRSGQKVIKIPIKKILSVHPTPDAVQITRDGKNAEPDTFSVDDPPFAADVITRLHQKRIEGPVRQEISKKVTLTLTGGKRDPAPKGHFLGHACTNRST